MNMTIEYLFWKDGQLCVEQRIYGEPPYALPSYGKKYHNCPCVEPHQEDPEDRYGVYQDDVGWEPRKLETFPPEFRATLLLMGIK